METTTTLRDETISHLQDLVRINVDSALGFEAAAELVVDPDLASLFRREARSRREAASRLREYVTLNDEQAALTPTLKGRLHRWWIELRGTVEDGDEHAMLTEAERGEDAILKCYADVLESNPGSAVSHVLHEQLRRVKESHDRIRALRDGRSG